MKTIDSVGRNEHSLFQLPVAFGDAMFLLLDTSSILVSSIEWDIELEFEIFWRIAAHNDTQHRRQTYVITVAKIGYSLSYKQQ